MTQVSSTIGQELQELYSKVKDISAQQWSSMTVLKWNRTKPAKLLPKNRLLVRTCFKTMRSILRGYKQCLLNGKAGRGKSMLLLWLAFELMMESLPITPAEPPSTVNPAVTVEIPAPSTSVAVTAPAVAAEAEVDVVTRDATVAYILRTGEAFIMSKSSFHVCNPKEISNVDFVLSDNVEVSQDGNFLTVLAISGDSHAAGAQHTISEFSKRVIEMGDDGFSLFLPPPSIEEVAAMVGTDPNSEAMQFKYDVVGGNVRAHMWTLWKHYDVVSDSFTEDNAVAGETVRDALACVFGAQYCNPQNTDKFNLASWAYYLITPWLVSKRVDSSLFREIPTKTSFTPEREVFVTVFMGILADMLQRDLDDLHCKQR